MTQMASYLYSHEHTGSNDLLQGTTFNGPLTPLIHERNIGQILDIQREKHPDRVAITSRWQDKQMTYQDLHATTQNLALCLLGHGIRPGDHVVVLAGNTIEYIQLFFAVGAIGAIFSIINPTFTKNEIIAVVDFLGMH
jgi:acyl-CoA synthetase (AMP-forming)/AMP-acid ligase II